MGLLTYFSYSSNEKTEQVSSEGRSALSSTQNTVGTVLQPSNIEDIIPSVVDVKAISTQVRTMETVNSNHADIETQIKVRRFSFKSFSFARKESSADSKPMLTGVREREKLEHASSSAGKQAKKISLSKSQKRARKSALLVRELIVGTSSIPAPPRITPALARPQLSKVKAQLLEPKAANKVILHLKQLPAHTVSSNINADSSGGLIHAVCLEHTDAEEHYLHFSKLISQDTQDRTRSFSAQDINLYGVASAPIEAITEMFREMHVVDLIGSPDFGLGQPGDGKGILAGAVPTAETVLEGVKQITPELMALGFATSKAVLPDHSGIYPPTDRLSVLTYWWGLEVLLPPPSLAYLSNVESVTGAVVNFLTALSVVNNGVREILPFIRYIAQFIDFEFSAIRKQDKGQGVVCAATWIMPAAMVPRPWDFSLPPDLLDDGEPAEGQQVPTNSNRLVTPPSVQHKPISSLLDTVIPAVSA